MPAKKVLSASTPVKKPSLASLKPDKDANVRARKKAVKKIETHVSKKSPAKKETIVLKKKTAATITGLGVRRATKKASVKKTPEVVVLPSNMSIRAREKTLALIEQISKDFHAPAQQIAYVSGLCFMLLGASMALAFSGTISGSSQSALLASTTSQLQSTANQIAAPVRLPELSLLDPLPVEATAFTEHKIAVLNAKNIVVKVRSLSDGSVTNLSVNDLSLELYKFSIDATRFSPGRHTVRAYAESTLDGSKHDFNLGEFLIPQAQSVPSGSGSSATTTPKTTSANEEEEEEEGEETINPVSSTVEPVAAAVASTTPPVPVASNGPALKVITASENLTGQVLVKVEAPKDLLFVEVYVRPPQSSNSRFVGLAEKKSDYWYFFFDTTNIPNGDYEIQARARFSGKDIYSTGVKARISNFVSALEKVPVAMNEEEVPDESTEEGELVEKETTAGRSLPDFTLTDSAGEDSAEAELAPLEIQEVLISYEQEIRNLFNRYAVAQQSGDALLVELALKELTTGKDKIITDILTNSSMNYLADDADKILTERFDALKKRVDTFEELRRTASNGETSHDTDKDGISDFDEQNLYSTDPNLPDTDNDGIQDGVEIMRGFDPLNSAPEAAIVYELPQESLGFVQDEVLKVQGVVPVIKTDEGGKVIQAEITGTALPNSYVTLYIFSTPTIVTVRADENGAFSYTFEKELEDGEHEVYVAITDNTGAIVAKSNPFRFIKQAEAFTPLDANASEVSNTGSFESIGVLNTYNTVVGIGILAFGLILLMLGVGMREKAGLAPKEPSHDLKAT
jgi:hypothetical protein